MFGSALAVSCLFFLSTGVNFVLGLYLAGRFGSSAEMDAFVASGTIPVFVGMVVAGSLAYPLQVNLVHTRQLCADQQVWEVCLAIAVIAGGLTLALALTAAIWAPALVALTTPGLKPEVAALSASLLRWQSPLIFLASLAVILGAWHNAVLNFLLPAGAQFICVLTTLLVALAAAPWLGVKAVALGSSGGALLQLLILTRGAARGLSMVRKPDFSHPAVARILIAAGPLLLGAGFVKTDAAIDRYLASSLPRGSISQLGYAWGLSVAVSGIVANGLATTSLSAMAAQIAGERLRELRDTFAGVVRMLAFLMAPVVVVTILCGPGVVALLLQHGRFTAADSQSVGMALACYTGLLIGHPLLLHLSNTFYAANDTRTPTVCIAAAYTVGIALKFGLAPHLGILGLAAATSLYYLLDCGLLSLWLLRRLGWKPQRETWRFAARMALCMAVTALAVYSVRRAIQTGAAPSALAGLVCTAVGGSVFASAAVASGLREPRIWLDGTLARLRWTRVAVEG